LNVAKRGAEIRDGERDFPGFVDPVKGRDNAAHVREIDVRSFRARLAGVGLD
jgi:hypothetical protein